MSIWQRMRSKLTGKPPAVEPPPPAPEPPPIAAYDTKLRTKKPTETGRRATRVPVKEPVDAAGWVEKGLSLVREGQAELALADFARAIALDENFSKAYAARGVAFEALGRGDEAKADYRKSIEIELRGVLKSEYGYEKKG